jgi:hypothetical protein
MDGFTGPPVRAICTAHEPFSGLNAQPPAFSALEGDAMQNRATNQE